jgi:type I restriction enzyme S subunit
MMPTRKFADWVQSYRNGFGRRPGNGETGPIVLRIADVSSGRIDLSSPRRGSVSAAEAATYLLSEGDLLFIRVNGARHIVGRCSVVESDIPSDVIFNDHLIRVRLKDGIDPQFAKLCMSLPGARSIIEEAASTSAGQLAISQQVLDSIDIPDLTIDEQRAFALRLGNQLGAVEEARNGAVSQIANLKALANALIRKSLAHPAVAPRLLGDVLEEIKHGIGSEWAGYPVLGATREGLAPAKEPVGKNPERYKPVSRGTVFYNPMRILIGSIAMVDDADSEGITSPDYVVLRGREGIVDSRWFYYWLRSPEGENCITSLARGAVRERMLFSRLAEGEIALPPYAVQRAASRALAEIRPMKQQVEAQLRDIDLLPGRLLAQTFEES